ncbi:YciI family protein [Agromyces sp. CCNWLW203]|uniref:YciI family protein n=1 Tax=Agromyces sp. CCNWLW203 TaxID=3112842 RepID=UPI002F96A303
MEYALFYAEGDEPIAYVPAADDIGAWVDDLERRGASEYGERLRPDEDATTVRIRDGQLLVTDGPFTESKESIGGFDIIDVEDLDEAIEIASRHPAAAFGRVEVRPFMQWPDADPEARVVPTGFRERAAVGRRYIMLVVAESKGRRAVIGDDGGEPAPTDDATTEDVTTDAPETSDDPDAWVDEMDARGTRLFGEVLRGPEDATFVSRRAGEVLVSDGPFAESKEWIAGFDVLEVQGLAEAIEVASKHPMARGGTLELRPLWPFDVHDDHVARTEREAAERGVRVEPVAGVALAQVAGAGS